jgi:hypothetical protein
MRVFDYFNSKKLPQLIINILNVAFIPLVFNQITFLSATLAVYRHLKNTGFVVPKAAIYGLHIICRILSAYVYTIYFC